MCHVNFGLAPTTSNVATKGARKKDFGMAYSLRHMATESWDGFFHKEVFALEHVGLQL